MAADVYQRLAKRLNELPNGFPATENGVELKILQKIFTPEDAEIALKIRPVPETAEAIAERLGKPVPEMKTILDNMAARGQIGCFKMAGQQMYMLFPFVVGIYEFQLNRIDKELADLFEEYAPSLLKTLGGYEPAFARVVPVNTSISADLQVHRFEDMRRMIEEGKSFRVQECICRKERALEGHRCEHTLENCLGFSKEERAFDNLPFQRGRVISKEEALKVLSDAEEEGLVHCTYNVEAGQVFVCNCCSCSCGILRGLKEYQAPYMLAKSNFVAQIDQELCEACGVCKDERCPIDAIVEEEDVYSVQAERCIGCGVCTVTCPTDAISLTQRAEPDIPPENLFDWGVKRAASRGIEIKID
jgi:electron transport complex protein RnfB